jgi:hypothetical protein
MNSVATLGNAPIDCHRILDNILMYYCVSIKIHARWTQPKDKGQKDKQLSTKIKDRVTRTPLKTGSELRCSGRVNLLRLEIIPFFNCCLSFFDLRILITPLVSSNSYIINIKLSKTYHLSISQSRWQSFIDTSS